MGQSRITTKSFIFRSSLILFLIVVSLSIFVPSSSWKKIFSGRYNMFAAAYSPTPNPEIYVINGAVNAIAPDSSGGAYIGGGFTSLGQNVGAGVVVSSSTGNFFPAFAKVSGGNGNVNVSVEDGNGGWYIGGNFTKVGTTIVKYVAHILSDGSVDPVFAPLESDINYEVFTMVLSTSTNRLYLGGSFSQIGGDFDRAYIAAINATDGSLISAFHPTTQDYVRALALSPDGNTLYLAGSFNMIGTSTADTSRNHIAAVNTTNGELTSFDPGADNEVDALALSSDGNYLYIGGNFNTFGGVTRNYLAQYDTLGATTTSFAPDPSAQVFSLAFSPDQTLLYFGGDFTTLAGGGTNRNYIAAVSTTTGIANAFDPSPDFIVYAIAPSTDGSTVYFGGDFLNINTNTTPVARKRLAAVNASDGSVISAFDSSLNSTVVGLSLSADGDSLYVAGYFNQIGITAHSKIAHILSDGTVDQDFDPSVTGGAINALAFSSTTNTLYLGGTFTAVDGNPRNRVAAMDVSNPVPSVTAFNPNADDEVKTLLLFPTQGTIYLGGYFTDVNGGTTRRRIAEVDATTGSTTSFDPDADAGVLALALSPTENTLYLGGLFSTVNGISRNVIAAVDAISGIITTFDPAPNDAITSLAFTPDGNTLYVGGDFTTFGGLPRNRIAAYNIGLATTTNFDPDIGSLVYAFALSGTDLYFGGNFTSVNTNTTPITRNRIASVDTSTGVISTTFNPNANASNVFALAISSDGNSLFMGGDFTSVGGTSTPKFVSFPLIQTSPSPSPSPHRSRVIIISSTPPIPLSSSTPTTTLTVLPKAILALAPGALTPSSTTPATISTSTPNVPESFCFNKNLSLGTTDSDVRYLQVFLNDQGLNVTVKGSETNYYGNKTSNGVVAFQRMTPGVLPGTGNFGNYTRKKANDILGCSTIFEISTTTPELPATTTPVIQAPTSTPPTTPENIPTVPAPEPANPELSPNLIDGIRQSYDQALRILAGSIPEISNILNSPTGSLVTKIITVGGLVLALFASLGAIAFATPATFSEIWLIPGRLAGLFLGALGIKRKIRRWGTVYDSVTKRPLDPVYVTLIDIATNKEMASAITDLDGRYGFLVAPGKYKIIAKKTNYEFPSQKMSGASFDEVYNDLYYGGEITVVTSGDTITKNIPMDSKSFDWNEFTKNKSNINTFLKKKDVTWAKLSKIVFVVGAVVSLLALVFAPRPYNLIIAALYVFAYVLNYFVFRVKKPGMIKERATNLPLSFAIVKIFREGMPADMPIIKKITDKFGKYYALVPKGNYSIEVDKKNDDGSYVQVFKSNMADIQNGIINEDLTV